MIDISIIMITCVGFPLKPLQYGLVVIVSASHAVDPGFTPRMGHIKDHHKNGMYAWHAGVVRILAVQPACFKGHVVCGTVWGHVVCTLYYKDLQGLIRKAVLYPGPQFQSSAAWPSMPKKHSNGSINQSIFPLNPSINH